MMNDQEGLAIAIEEAKISYEEGGVPVSIVCHVILQHNLSPQQIGAALVSKDGKLLGRGHNQRVQKGSAIHHVREACLFLYECINFGFMLG